MLEFGKKPPVAMNDFLEACQRLLSSRDFTDVICAVNSDEENAHNPTLKSYHQFERYLRNELVALRARQLNKDPLVHMRGERGVDTAVVDAVNQAMKSPDPLAAEKILDQASWQRLDALAAGHYFDLEYLIIYAIKLKILARYDQIGSKKGQEDFQQTKEHFVNKKIVYS